jgi:hypothetical protein
MGVRAVTVRKGSKTCLWVVLQVWVSLRIVLWVSLQPVLFFLQPKEASYRLWTVSYLQCLLTAEYKSKPGLKSKAKSYYPLLAKSNTGIARIYNSSLG